MAELRIERAERAGQVVWIKHYNNTSRRLSIALLRWLARRLGANSLLAPKPLSGEAACASELAMLRRLAALGVPVPQVLEVRARELVLSDLGPILTRQLRQPSLVVREAALSAAFDALRDLHRRGGYASQAVARNLTWREGVVGFIDFEEDPAQMMSLAAAQARDWLLFVYSTARFFDDAPERFRALLEPVLQAEPASVRVELFATARALRWLPPLARPFGRRARGVAQGVQALVRAAARG